MIFTSKKANYNEVKTILMKLNKNISSGYDEIPIPPIVDGASETVITLMYLINRSMREFVFPSSKKCAKVTPVYKSRRKCLVDNYRPVSVLPVFGRCLNKW